MSFDEVAAAAEAAGITASRGPHRDRAARARTRADAQRGLALWVWAQAAVLESTAN